MDRIEARKAANALTRLTKKLRKSFEKELAKNAKKDPKSFWKYIQSMTKTRVNVGELTKSDGSMTSGTKEKVDRLNEFFSSVFTNEDTASIPEVENKPCIKPLSTVLITPDKVKAKLKKLKKTKSAGPDGFHPRVLRECAEELSTPLSIIFNKSLHESHLPHQWKEAEVRAIYKNKGKRTEPGNYRPISLTSVIGKVMESIIRDDLVQHMIDNKLFCDEQHGFVPGRSCITQLLCCMEDWTMLLDQGYPIDTIYMDFQKAFDSVPHRRLLAKLKGYGITGRLLKWMEDFLIGRKQRVVMGNESSEWSNVISGIPQGSVLGPTLFVIFINDIPNGINSLLKIFADDTKIYRAVRNIGDRLSLQKDINSLTSWSRKWQLPFNIGKCDALSLGYSNIHMRYFLNGNRLKSVEEEKDLGVIVDEKLNFHSHIAEATAKANRILGCIRRSIKFKNEDIIMPLYKAHVRSRLEYGSVIWNPYQAQDKIRVERVQRRATKMVKGLENLTYEGRLKKLELPSLQHRRRRSDMLQVFKIIMQLERIEAQKFFTPGTSFTRGHSKKLFKPRPRLDIRKNFFSLRVIEDWNSLPQHLIDSEDLDDFKAGLDELWAEQMFSNPFS